MARLVRGRTKVDGDRLRGAVTNLSDATGVPFTLADVEARLDEGEMLELIEIHSRLSTPIDGGFALQFGPSIEERAVAEAFVQRLRSETGARRPWVNSLLAEFTERQGRPPTDAELRVYHGAGKASTHESLAPKLEAARARENAGHFVVSAGPSRTTNPLALLPGDEERLQALVEKAADDPGHFERRREDAMRRIKIAELAERVRPKPPRKPLYDPPGAVRFPPAVFEHLALKPRPALELRHLGLLTFVVAQLEHGVCLCPGGRIEGEGAEARLVVGPPGLGARWDPESDFIAWEKLAEHLARNGWLTVERVQQEWKVGRGRRLLEIDEAAA